MRNCSHRVSIAFALLLTVVATAFGKGKQESDLRTVNRVEEKILPPDVRYEFSRTVGSGRLKLAREGRPGFVRRTYRVSLRNGRQVGKELLREEKAAPAPALYLMGFAGFPQSRGAFMRRKVLTMTATAYDPSPATIGRGATGFTRTGIRAKYGVVAVDPRVIPLNSLVYVEGYGFAIAADTGSAIKGSRIDLCYNSRSQSIAYGKRRLKVHVLGSR